MEATNRKLYAKDLTPVALTSNHKRAVVGAYVEGKLKMYNTPAIKPKENNSSKNEKPNTNTQRGGGRGGRGGNRGTDRGRGGRGGRGRGGGAQHAAKKTNSDQEQNKQKQQSRDGNQIRGEQLPLRSKKKLVDRIKDPHVQAMIRNQLDTGDVFFR